MKTKTKFIGFGASILTMGALVVVATNYFPHWAGMATLLLLGIAGLGLSLFNFWFK